MEVIAKTVLPCMGHRVITWVTSYKRKLNKTWNMRVVRVHDTNYLSHIIEYVVLQELIRKKRGVV